MMFDLLLERALNGLLLEGVHKFSSVQFDVKGGLRKKILSFVRGLPAGALAGDGRETRPHITVKYGLHTSDPAVVEEVISGCKPFTVKLGKLSAFYAPDDADEDQCDVLKIGVSGAGLRALNKLIGKNCAHTDSHPTYNPHLTLAYLKPGLASEYVGLDDFSGEEIDIDRVIFSSKDGDVTVIKLDG